MFRPEFTSSTVIDTSLTADDPNTNIADNIYRIIVFGYDQYGSTGTHIINR